MQKSTEQGLIDRSRAGDREAFEQLIEEYAQRLLASVRAALGDRIRQRLESGDIVQQVYVDALEHIDRFTKRDRSSFLSWLKRIARNRICDVDRRVFRTAKRNRELRVADIPAAVSELIGEVVDPAASPSQDASQAELLGLLAHAMAKLIPSQREALELRYFERLSAAETAIRMGRSEPAIRQLCTRALIQLRRTLAHVL